MYNEDRKLFVGGLGWDSTEKQLNEYFSKYGAIESINVKTNPNTGRSRGFAFVVFTNTDSLDQVLGSDHIINGRRVDAKRAIARTGKIFVGGLKSEISDDDIKHFFSQFGKVIDVKIPFDRERNQRKGFCFITFEEEHVVNDLLKNPQQTISGVPVDLRKATPKADTGYNTGSSRGGRYQGYGESSGRGSGYNGSYDSYSGYGNYGGSNYDGYGYNYGSSYDGQKDGSYQASRYQPY